MTRPHVSSDRLDAIAPLVDRERADEARIDCARIASLVHDLKTPVHAVLGWVSLVKQQQLQGPALDHVLRVIERNLRLESDLLTELLEAMHLAERGPRHALAPVDFAELVRSMIDNLRPMALHAGVDLHTRTPDEEVLVAGRAQDLARIVTNLVCNAIKFSHHGGAVGCAVAREGEWVRLAVRDQGSGIAPEFLPRVFDAFCREPHPAQPAPDGAGLGLSVVRQLAQRYGGSVRADSEGHGRGATFTVTLPAALATRAARWMNEARARQLPYSGPETL